MSMLYRFANLLSGVWGASSCFIGFIQAPFQTAEAIVTWENSFHNITPSIYKAPLSKPLRD
jgi:hypothetical protein